MKKIIMNLLLLSITLSICAQEDFSMEEGKITQYEADLVEYSADKDAEALVIYEKGEYEFIYEENYGFILYMTISTKIKILKQSGIKYATFEIPYYTRDIRAYEQVDNIKGTTYNYENETFSKSELDSKNIFEEKGGYKWNQKKVTLPNVKVGSIIEFKYKISTPFFVNMRTWEFQKKIPVVHSTLKYLAVPYYEYTYIYNGIKPLDAQTSTIIHREIVNGRLHYKKVDHTYVLNNIPAFRDESFISSEKDFIVALRFQLSRVYNFTGGQTDYISTWPKLVEKLSNEAFFGKYINDSQKEAKKILPSLDIENKSIEEKVKIITTYVKENFNWNLRYNESSTQKASDFVKTKRGSVGDINLFLVGALKAAGINADAVILSTRENGRINADFPFLHFFNYVTAQVNIDNKKTYLDATEPILAYNILPSRCVNTIGLVVNSKESEWILMNQRSSDYLQKTLILDLDIENNKIVTQAEYGAMGIRAYLYRAKYMGKNQDLIKYLKDSENIEVEDNIEVKNYNEYEKPLSFDFSFSLPLEKSSDKIFLNPFCNLQSTENPFKQLSRIYPIDINSIITRNYSATIKIPDGYVVEYLPTSHSIKNDIMIINYSSFIEEGKIIVEASYSLLKYTYPASEYDILKESYSQMISKFSEMIILKKEEGAAEI